MQLIDFEARLVVAIADALEDGGINRNAPTVTARQVAAALGQTGRSAVNDMGDLLTKLGVFHRMKGPNPYQRPVVELVSAIAAHEEQAPGAGQQDPHPEPPPAPAGTDYKWQQGG